MRTVAEAEKDHQSFIDGGHLFPGKLAKYATDPPLVDGSQMVDQGEGLLREAALAPMWGRARQPHLRRGLASRAPLYPTLAGDPLDRLARAAVNERLGVFLG
jgi:hypothetical protein